MYSFRNLIRKVYGGALVEFALVFPLLLAIFVGLYDYAYYILLHNKLSRASGAIAFIVSKQDIKASALTSVLANAFVILKPFDFKTNGTIITSQIGLDSRSSMIINWQRKSGSAASKIGVAGGAPAALPNNLVITGQERIVVTEAYYSYRPFFSFGVLVPKEMYKISIYPPRIGLMDSLLVG
jgi:Flp pilus assembly protein TadG